MRAILTLFVANGKSVVIATRPIGPFTDEGPGAALVTSGKATRGDNVRRLQIVAGSAFIGAWIIGVALAADGPKPTDSATQIAGYFSAHEHKAMLAHLLIDGVAGADRHSGLVVELPARGRRAARAGRPRCGNRSRARVLRTARARRAADAPGRQRREPGEREDALHGANDGDTVKIASIALMIGVASLVARRSSAFPPWLATSGLVFAPLLALSGLAFPLESDALCASLELTLVLLLAWVVAVTVVIARRAREPEPAPALAS
jgi:hypothetical protein